MQYDVLLCRCKEDGRTSAHRKRSILEANLFFQNINQLIKNLNILRKSEQKLLEFELLQCLSTREHDHFCIDFPVLK